jgi:hypothetical protein
MTEEFKRGTMDLFVSIFDGTYVSVPNQKDLVEVFDSNGSLIATALIVEGEGEIKDSYPLTISARKLLPTLSNRMTVVIIWSCSDGIIYGRLNQIEGSIKWAGHKNYGEPACYFYKQTNLKYKKV